ncbi:DnaB-like helicase C-terminal domain-containing protein [Mycoplasmopsis lipophila]|uniref:DnaB-like helicase C-terminal domain-containing protein n=1 Tax=Mycoplasmopsis lipophila TaxID=2117 RepID=UPI003873C5E0
MSSSIYELSNLSDKYDEFKKMELQDKKLFTNFRNIDKYIDGLQNRCLYILAARPGTGKTTLAQNIMTNVAKQLKQDEYVLFLSLELSAVDVYKKFLQIESNWLTRNEINDLEPTEAIKNELNRVKDLFKERKILIFDNELGERITPSYIQNMLDILKSQNIKIRTVFIDYFQQLESNLINSIEYKAQEDTSKQLKQIAKINNINVFCLSQLSREYEKRRTMIPTFSDLKGTSSIEQDADIIMFLYSQNSNSYETKTIQELSLTIAKNRNGLCNTSSLIFNTEQAKFYEKDNFTVIEKYSRSENGK